MLLYVGMVSICTVVVVSTGLSEQTNCGLAITKKLNYFHLLLLCLNDLDLLGEFGFWGEKKKYFKLANKE